MNTLQQHLAAHGVDDTIPNGFICTCGEHIHIRTAQLAWQARDAHVAATWREARTVHTAEELDAIKGGAILIDAKGCFVQTPYRFTGPDLPALVVWTPEDDAL